MLAAVLRENRMVRVSHTIVHVEEALSGGFQLHTEYHLHLAKTGSSPVASADKSLGVSFQLPDGVTQVLSVTLNGELVLPNGTEDFAILSYTSLPGGADTRALGSIFSRLTANRRDLISYEEIRKTHRSASAHAAWGLLLNIPLEASQADSLSIGLTVHVSSLGEAFGELWFPICAGLVLLPSGAPATRQLMEYQRHRVTVKLRSSHQIVVCSGDMERVSETTVFESAWLNPRACGLYLLPDLVLEHTVVASLSLQVYVAPALLARAQILPVVEIVHFFQPWFADALPSVSLLFVSLPTSGTFLVQGNCLLLDEDALLPASGLVERQISATALLAEAFASLWIARIAFSEPWIPVGLASMLAERFVAFHFGANETSFRSEAKRAKLHNMVERGLDWRPLCVIGEEADPLMRIKAGLVMDCLVRSVVGEPEMRTAMHELGGAKIWDTDTFWALLVSTVGPHTEAGRSLGSFRNEWVRGVGVPLIHVGFTMVDKKRFLLSANQRPLQRVNAHDNVPLCGKAPGRTRNGCACGQDFVERKDENGATSYMRPHVAWPAGRRRFWPGDLEVSIFRSSIARVTATVNMAPEDDIHSTLLTIPFVSPRKHELVLLQRTAREDELVHGWLAVTDSRWMLAKVVLCQSALMWANQLQWSRQLAQELVAVEALQHVRGSALICELLRDVLGSQAYSFRVRQEAGKALVHLAIGCGEREAGEFVIQWLSETAAINFAMIRPQDYLTVASVSEQLAYAKRSIDRRDHAAVAAVLLQIVRAIEHARTVTGVWTVDPDQALAKALKLALIGRETSDESVPQIAAVWMKSDEYGPPLASRDLVVTEALLPICRPAKPDELVQALALTPNNRRLSRTAIRTYLLRGDESESAWRFRFSWIEKLTEQINPNNKMQFCAWLVDCWELVLERIRRDHAKSALHVLIQTRETCDRLWSYLTAAVPLLPLIVRPHVEACVHAIYLQAYGTWVPPPYREITHLAAGPISFWLPFREHDKIYRKFLLRGTTVKAELPPAPPPKKPRLLITSQGSVSLAKDELGNVTTLKARQGP